MNDWIIVKNEKSNCLAHHGIEKQKWGVRHGPPYPLDYEDHSKAQKKEISKYKFTSKKSQLSPKQRIKNTSKTKVSNNAIERAKYKLTKVLVKMGIKKVDASMQTYGEHPFLDFVDNVRTDNGLLKSKNLLDGLTSTVQDITTDFFGHVESRTLDLSYDKYGSDFLRNKDYKRETEGLTNNELYSINLGHGKNNCVACTLAGELINQGYKGLQAGVSKYGNSDYSVEEYFPGSKIENISNIGSDIDNWVKDKYGNGTSGYFAGSYSGKNDKGSTIRTGGHAIHWNITKDGEIKVQDGQNGRNFDSFSEAINYYGFDKNMSSKIARLDNVTPNFKALISNGIIAPNTTYTNKDSENEKYGTQDYGSGLVSKSNAYTSYGGEKFDSFDDARSQSLTDLYSEYKKYKKETYWDDNW